MKAVLGSCTVRPYLAALCFNQLSCFVVHSLYLCSLWPHIIPVVLVYAVQLQLFLPLRVGESGPQD